MGVRAYIYLFSLNLIFGMVTLGIFDQSTIELLIPI